MTPEATRHIARAREDLDDARQVAQIGLAKVAARSAYYAAFHAAEAFIIEKTGRVAKTHSGVRSVFARLARAETRFDRTMTSFLAQGYQYKEVGDYNVDPAAAITMRNAEAAISAAADFLQRVEAALAD